ncbi:MAG TPA: AarF/UbiB family protein [Jatrophihabitans sp.]|nr:AarF/UbiB family protein [Jatrophihabitans sp.]
MRSLVIGYRVAVGMLIALGSAAGAARRGRPEAKRELARQVTQLLIRLGPTFVKAGQILGARRDIVPPVLCDELSVLRDEVPGLSPEQSRAALVGVYGADLDRTFDAIDYVAVAAASVACVYRASLLDGTEVALKLQRPGISRLMAADLALVRRGAAMVARLPAFRGVPVRELMDNLCDAVLGQLDFDREADSLRRMRTELSALPRVLVPRVHVELSRPTCIVMDYLPGLDVGTGARCSLVARREFAASTLNVMYQMLFIDGFVHCDLHPGNLYFLPTGQVVVLDAGFSVQLSDTMRRLFAEFFLNMSIGRGRRCARIVIESSLGLRPGADVEWFSTELAALVDRNFGLSAKEFSLIGFATEMFDIQRRHGIVATPELVFPLLSLLVIEPTVRELDPDIDFQVIARPVLNRALFAAVASIT